MEETGNLPPVRDDGLQLEDHPAFQQRFWMMQRVAWGAFGVVLLVALAGFTGSGGLFSRAEIAVAEGRLDYPRVARWQTPETLRIAFSAGDERHRLLFSSGFEEDFALEQILPQPEREQMTADGLLLEFAATAGAASTAVLDISPRSPGLASFTLGIDRSPPLRVTVVVLP